MADDQADEPLARLGGLFDGREEWGPQPLDGKASVLAKGLIALDANVLLNLYRFGAESRRELLDVLGLLGDRLFIPAQAALEFSRNRLCVAMEMRQELVDGPEKAKSSLRDLGAELQALGRERGLSQAQKGALTRALKRAEKRIRRVLKEAATDRDWADRPSSEDPLLPEIITLLDGKVGRPYSKDDTERLHAEGKKRIDARIPPGFKDANKDDPYGDFIVWRQVLAEAAVRGVPILFVSDDVKEDWVLRVRGRTVGLLPELIREAKNEANVAAFHTDVVGFLRLAQSALQAEVSEETIEEASPRPMSSGRAARLTPAEWVETSRLLQELVSASAESENLAQAMQSSSLQRQFEQAYRTLRLNNPTSVSNAFDESTRAIHGTGRHHRGLEESAWRRQFLDAMARHRSPLQEAARERSALEEASRQIGALEAAARQRSALDEAARYRSPLIEAAGRLRSDTVDDDSGGNDDGSREDDPNDLTP